MKKNILALLIIIVVVLSAVSFVACSEDSDPHAFVCVKLTDGTITDMSINVSYKYGEELAIFDSLKIVIEYKDGSVTIDENSTEKDDITIKYYKEQTEIEAFGKHSTLAPGNYSVTATYKGSAASLNIYISAGDFSDGYRIYLKEAEAQGINQNSSYVYETSAHIVPVLYKNSTLESNDLLNALYVLTQTEKSEYDALTTKEAKAEYLQNHATTPLAISDQTGYVDTTMVIPGQYYMFGHINATDIEDYGYSAPINSLRIEKGRLVITDAMLTQWNVHGEYAFRDFVFDDEEPKMTKDNVKALEISEVEIKHNDGAEINIMGSDSFIDNVGTFVYTNTSLRVDASNNGSTTQVRFALDEFYAERYIVTKSAETTMEASWQMPLQITKGSIYSPYFTGAVTEGVMDPVFYYDGTSHSILGDLNTEGKTKFINITGSTQGTNAGNYTLQFALKDTINYQWRRDSALDNYYFGTYTDEEKGNVSFTWSIGKASGYPQVRKTYLGQEYDDVIQYVRDVANNKEVSIELYSDCVTQAINQGLSFVWTYDYGGAMSQNITIDTTKTGNTNTAVFSDLDKSSYDYVNIYVTIPASTNYHEVTEYCFTVQVRPAEYTVEEQAQIKAALPAVGDDTYFFTGGYNDGSEDYGHIIIEAHWTLSVDSIDSYKLKAGTIPAAISGLGAWHLYMDVNNELVEVFDGQTIANYSGNSAGKWVFKFIPEDPCITNNYGTYVGAMEARVYYINDDHIELVQDPA